VRTQEIDHKIKIDYLIINSNRFQSYNVNVYVSFDGGRTFLGPIQRVSGDVGKDVTYGSTKSIMWDAYQEFPAFNGKALYNIQLEVIQKDAKPHLYLGYKGSYNVPLGLLMGINRKRGFYVSCRVNNQFFINQHADFLSEGEIIKDYDLPGHYEFTSKVTKQRLSATIGVTLPLSFNFHWYIGGGQAVYNYLVEISEYNEVNELTGTALIKNTKKSYTGFELETGFFLKTNHVFMSAGIASPAFKTVEAVIAIGIYI
jgi:hypothetical protein